MNRCSWVNMNNELYIKYHDEEWGRKSFNDNYLFEMLLLESFQAGLSWECILNKRENFRAAFDNFNIDKIINYDEEKINMLLNNKGIIRNKLKIIAAINNAKIFKKIQKEYGSFSNYIWSFTSNKVIYEIGKTKSELSDNISKDLNKRGMKFVGTIVIYSYLQAIGIINSHDKDCFLYMEEKWKKLWRSYTRNKKEYKKLIYVSETDNSKLMKYENYNTKYELINSFVSPIFLGAIIMFLLRIFYKKIYKVD